MPVNIRNTCHEVIEIDETTYLPQIEKPEEFCEQVEILLDPK